MKDEMIDDMTMQGAALSEMIMIGEGSAVLSAHRDRSYNRDVSRTTGGPGGAMAITPPGPVTFTAGRRDQCLARHG